MINEERYLDYMIDIDIAQNTIRNLKLFPEKNIICDLYSIPSYNLQSYYMVIYEKNGILKAVYAKPQIITPKYGQINMYRFVDVIDVEKSENCKGNIIVGIVDLNINLAMLIKDIINNIPEKFIFEDQGIYIDGVVQGIRVYKDNRIVKEILYRNAEYIHLSNDKQYLKKELENLYAIIGENIC